MAGDTVITIIGNLTADPELRFTPSGAAVANFTVASTPRQFDRQSNEWKDGETRFMRVIVSGRLKSRSYETKEGEKRTVVEMDVDEIGPSLRSATAKVNKTQRGGGGGGFGGGQGNQGGGWSGGSGGQAEDPWATGGSAGGQAAPAASGGQQGGWNQSSGGGQQGGGQQGGGWGAAPSYDEPPF